MRILLADDQAKVRFALGVLLGRQVGFEVIGEAVDAQDLLARAEAACPDVVLLAWELPGMAAGEVVAALQRMCPGLVVIALSGRLEARQVALAAGADAFVCKCESPERLLAAIKACCSSGIE
jgi:two-component system nitrate/nitrite response regulator NarL